MSQKKEKYARWKEHSVVDLQERMDKLEREMTIRKTVSRNQEIELENLQGQMMAMRIAGRERAWQEERRRQQQKAMRAARAEQRREERNRRRAVALFFVIVIGALLAILLMPEGKTRTEQPPVIRETSAQDYITAALLTAEPNKTEKPVGRYGTVTNEERELLARLVWAEARGESAEGQQIVAEVVLNRRAADNFPDSIREVIFERRQFSTAGILDQAEPGEEQYDAVDRALTGENILPMDVVFFSREAENDRVWGKVGNHVFCYQYIWE